MVFIKILKEVATKIEYMMQRFELDPPVDWLPVILAVIWFYQSVSALHECTSATE